MRVTTTNTSHYSVIPACKLAHNKTSQSQFAIMPTCPDGRERLGTGKLAMSSDLRTAGWRSGELAAAAAQERQAVVIRVQSLHVLLQVSVRGLRRER